MEEITFRPIAHIRSDFAGKFAIPRQSGLVEELRAEIVFRPEFRSAECLRGLEGYSHIWLLWVFSANREEGWNSTVRPPRLGGNARMGVFATRSPYRPNPIALSSVQLLEVVYDSPDGPLLRVGGADLMDGTPILDIKPYVGEDCHPDAALGFTRQVEKRTVRVQCAETLLHKLPEEKRAALLGILTQDPRPAYHDDPRRSYGFVFAGHEIRFQVSGTELTVTDIL